MAADEKGNDILAVGLPVDGSLGFAPSGTIVLPAAGAADDFALPIAWKKAGLLTTDGGFNWTTEPDGDAIEFFQDGYTIPSGLASVTLTVKLAQYDDNIRSLIYGGVPDEHGYMEIDGGGTANRYALFSEEIFKNGAIRRRNAVDAGITGITLDQSTRGEVNGVEVVFTIARSPQLHSKHFGEWLLTPEA